MNSPVDFGYLEGQDEAPVWTKLSSYEVASLIRHGASRFPLPRTFQITTSNVGPLLRLNGGNTDGWVLQKLADLRKCEVQELERFAA